MLLVTVAPGHQLAPGPAVSYARMRAAGCPEGIAEAWRSTATQAIRRADYLAGRGAFALPPGRSRHELGEALDLPRAAAAWVRANPAHGWRFTNGKEWWHVEYVAALDRHRDDPAPPPQAPAPTVDVAPADPFEEDEMERLIEALYETLLGRPAGRAEVNAWLTTAASEGLSSRQLADRFPGARAEGVTVTKAYADYLGRPPAPAEVDAWLSTGPTIAQVRAGVGGAPEATARR